MFKFKNKILLLIFSLQIFANFNSKVLCSRTDAQGLHVATALAKYAAFATSNAYGLKGDESKELTLENIYLALDVFDSFLKVDHLMRENRDEAAALIAGFEVGSIIYDIVALVKNVNELNKLKKDENSKIKKNKVKDSNVIKQNLSPSMKKKIFYTFVKHSAALADVASTIDFTCDTGRDVKISEALLSIFLKVFSRCIDNKSVQIPNKALACLSTFGTAILSGILVDCKGDDARNKRRERDRRERVRREARDEAARMERERRADEERLRREREAADLRFAPRRAPERVALAELQRRYGERVENHCSICSDDLDRNILVTSACHHVFCQGCLNQWRAAGRSASRTCPNCREPISEYVAPIPFELVAEPEARV